MRVCRKGHAIPEEQSMRGCKVCKNEKRREWRLKNPEKNKASDQRYIDKNRDKYLARKKRYYQKNQEKAQGYYPLQKQRKPLYSVYNGMMQRCYNENCDKFKFYGGRGITVCDRWRGDEGYENFVEDMAPRPDGKHTLDRRNTNGNYEKDNCRWVLRTVQVRNRIDSRMVTIMGRTQNAIAWVQETGIPKSTFWQRLKNGWEGPKLISPVRGKFRKKGIAGESTSGA